MANLLYFEKHQNAVRQLKGYTDLGQHIIAHVTLSYTQSQKGCER